MTKEILTNIAKTKKINLKHFDHVFAYINEKYTKVFIKFANLEVCGGDRYFMNQTVITLSVNAIQKRCYYNENEPQEWEYTTQGWEWISDIR